MAENKSIAEFLRGKNVFITGGTGFIGKMFVEKILRSCPDVDTIYLLARQKKNKSATERVQELTESPLFDILRQKMPAALNKIKLVEGDIAEECLGMSKADQLLFCEKINVIIHSAATISFTEPLKVAVATNLRSVKELLKLAKRVKNLDSFVHVSTAYTNWFRLDVEEKFYKPKYDPNEVIDMCRSLSDEELNQKIPSIEPHLNTYTFTKSLAEYLVSQEGKDLPIAIVRPSIVAASLREPFPGWVDNWGGSTFFCYMIAKGLLRNMEAQPEIVADKVPADLVVNMTLAAAFKVGTDPTARNSLPTIYHCVSSSKNPVMWYDLLRSFATNGRKYPLSDVVWYPEIKFWKSGLMSRVSGFVTQIMPAYVCDLGLRLIGKKPRFVKTQKFTAVNFKDVRFAPNNRIFIRSENSKLLAATLNASDLKTFDFDVRKIDWNKYFDTYYHGVRKYLCKDTSENYPALRRRVTAFKYANLLLMGTTVATSLYLVNKSREMLTSKDNKNVATKPISEVKTGAFIYG